MRYTFHLGDINTVVRDFMKELTVRHETGPCVILFSGNLGAGKTTFIQALAKQLGVTEQITSPTFTMMRRYVIPENEVFEQLYHFDLYRIEDVLELDRIGWNEALSDPKGLICVEWPERAGDRLPEKVYDVVLEHTDDPDMRTLVF